MESIKPFLWFDKSAMDAARFYCSIFKDADLPGAASYGEAGPNRDQDVMVVSFRIAGQEFMALNGGPSAPITPAVSFFVQCETEEEVDGLWASLSADGDILMPLDRYPFSPKYGWTADKFGVSWQVSLAGTSQRVNPALMYTGAQAGRAEEAINFYASIFERSRVDAIHRYELGEPDTTGTVKFATFSLAGQPFSAMDSSHPHAFNFTHATSFFITCETQADVDYLWDSLSDGGVTNQCGWTADKFGVSWQVVPKILGELLGDPDPEKARRSMEAMLQMTKLDIAKLQAAHDGV